jgi:hypothetical protein
MKTLQKLTNEYERSTALRPPFLKIIWTIFYSNIRNKQVLEYTKDMEGNVKVVPVLKLSTTPFRRIGVEV